MQQEVGMQIMAVAGVLQRLGEQHQGLLSAMTQQEPQQQCLHQQVSAAAAAARAGSREQRQQQTLSGNCGGFKDRPMGRRCLVRLSSQNTVIWHIWICSGIGTDRQQLQQQQQQQQLQGTLERCLPLAAALRPTQQHHHHQQNGQMLGPASDATTAAARLQCAAAAAAAAGAYARLRSMLARHLALFLLHLPVRQSHQHACSGWSVYRQ